MNAIPTKADVEASRRIKFDAASVDAIFCHLNQCQHPGAAVGIAIDGYPVYRKGFGLAAVEQPVILTPGTRMSLGSVTKHFTALGFLLLCESGKAALDTPIGTWLRELHPTARRVTVRQLLGHISGLRDATDFVYQLAEASRWVSSSDVVNFYRDLSHVNFEPGSGFNYNNAGYVLVGAIIERITDMSLEDYLSSSIFAPVGLNDTLLRRSDMHLVQNCARGHLTTHNGTYLEPRRNVVAAGQGGIVSTVDDMLRWMRQFKAPTVGLESSWLAMQTPMTLLNGCSTSYGLGLMIDEYRGLRTLAHAGNAAGANAHMITIPSLALDVIVMANRSDTTSRNIAHSVVDACVEGLADEQTAGTQTPISGTYVSRTTGRVVQFADHQGQQIVVVDGFPLEFVQKDDSTMRPSQLWRFFKFEIEARGTQPSPHAIQFSDCGQSDVLEQQGGDGYADSQILSGSYECTDSGLIVTVSILSPESWMQVSGQFGWKRYPLRPLGGDIWRAADTLLSYDGAFVTFDRNGEWLSITTGRNLALRFRRSRKR